MRTLIIAVSMFALLSLRGALLTSAPAISGVVTDGQGRGLLGVRVELESLDGKTRYQSKTDATGHFRFESASPNQYSLVAEEPSSVVAIYSPVSVLNDGSEQKIQLDPLTNDGQDDVSCRESSLSGSITELGFEPPRETTLCLTRNGGTLCTHLNNSRYAIFVQPGIYELSVRASNSDRRAFHVMDLSTCGAYRARIHLR
jgi:hypothetical protein